MSTCTPYKGALSNLGYGLQAYAGKTRLAHRVAYCKANALDITDFPSSTVVRHSCDNRACVNPLHLIAGTQSENCIDRSVRAPRGKKRKLTPEQITAIRPLDPGIPGRSMAASVIGREYNVHESTIRNVWNGKYWGHV